MSGGIPEQTLDLAVRAADAAGDVARKYFRSSFEIEKKDDLSPVTVADRESETVIRAIIEGVFPDHGIPQRNRYEHHEKSQKDKKQLCFVF